MPNQRAYVDAESRPDEIEILAEALPFEGHARIEGRLLDVLDLAEHLDELATRAFMHRCEAQRAIADHDGRHAMLEARGGEAIPA